MRTADPLAAFLQDPGPVPVSLQDIAGNVPGPLLPDLPVVIQVELSVHDRPRLGVDISRVPTAHRPRSVAAVSGSVFLRIAPEKLEVLLFRKPPPGAVPIEADFGAACDGFPDCEIGDNVIPLDDYTARVGIDGRQGISSCMYRCCAA